MRKNKNYKKLFYVLILFAAFSLSIGYSAFSSELSISKIVADVRIKRDVRITSVSLLNMFNADVLISDLNYDSDSIVTNVKLDEPDSYVTYKVTISNLGNQEVGILNISVPDGIGYEISDYNLKDKICDSNNLCSLGITKEITLKIYPVSSAGVLTENIKIDFDFRTYHKVTYTGINNNGYPIEVIDGGDLSITFKEDLKNVTIISNAVEIANYDQVLNGQTIMINNITSDIEVKEEEKVIRLVSGDLETVGSEVCIKDECFYIISNDGSTVAMLAKYNLHVGNMVDKDWDITPLSNLTGIQDESAKGAQFNNSFNNIYPYIGTTAFSNVDCTYSGSLVEEYINNYVVYLEEQEVKILNARLILKNELELLGCNWDELVCSPEYEWVYTTSYWSGATEDIGIWCVYSSASILDFSYDFGYEFGVRPVIEIPVWEFSETKDVIIHDKTYEYKDGMTWEEWISSRYNVDNFVAYNKACARGLSRKEDDMYFHLEENSLIDNSYVYGFAVGDPPVGAPLCIMRN